jgi:hypothetical protein
MSGQMSAQLSGKRQLCCHPALSMMLLSRITIPLRSILWKSLNVS